MAHLRIADLVGGVGEQRDFLFQQRRGLEVVVAGQGTDGDLVAPLLDERQIRNPSDIDEDRWNGKS